MTASPESPFSLPAALGAAAWRAAGIASWQDVAVLGRANLRALRDYAQDGLTEIQPGLQRLSELAESSVAQKPLLPRLRRENFRRAEAVRVFLGESLGPPWKWLRGTVVAIEKSYKVDWKGFEPNSGYYWRISVQLRDDAPEQFKVVHFSTSEPRVLPEVDYAWLLEHAEAERRFLEVFAQNAKRMWQPLWCLELGIAVDAAAMDPLAWLIGP